MCALCYTVTKYSLCKPIVVYGVISLPDAAATLYDNKALIVCGSAVFSTGFVMQYYTVPFLVEQSFYCGRESWLLYFDCLLAVIWPLVFCVSSSRCCGMACSV